MHVLAEVSNHSSLPARPAAWTRRQACVPLRTPRGQLTTPGCSCMHAARASASSMASLVPDPIEKCAVCAASPRRTTLSCARLVPHGQKLIHRESFAWTAWPPRMYPAKRRRINAMVWSSLSPGRNGTTASAPNPARCQTCVVHLDDERASGCVDTDIHGSASHRAGCRRCRT